MIFCLTASSNANNSLWHLGSRVWLNWAPIIVQAYITDEQADFKDQAMLNGFAKRINCMLNGLNID